MYGPFLKQYTKWSFSGPFGLQDIGDFLETMSKIFAHF